MESVEHTVNIAMRILSDLDSAFRRHPNICEFDILPVKEPETNRSPVIVAESALGLELWSAKLLYMYCYSTIMQWRSFANKCSMLRSTDVVRKNLEPSELLRLSRAALLINPECYSIWNIRKELFQKEHITLTEELKLGELVLSKHPKSPETFAHRKWVLMFSVFSAETEEKSQVNTNQPGSCCTLVRQRMRKISNEELIPTKNEEMRVCTMAAGKYANNYNAWSHRIWFITNVLSCDAKCLMTEYEKTKSYVSMHVSDHSGFHYRQFLINNLDRNPGILQQELGFVSELISSYPGHETLWYHRRFVIHAMMNTPAQSRSSSKNSEFSISSEKCDLLSTFSHKTLNDINHGLLPEQSKYTKKIKIDDCSILVTETKEVKLIIDSEPQNSWQQQLAKAYLKWVRLCYQV